MKNKSCQAKKRGKLVEMSIEEAIQSCWQDWSEIQKEEESANEVHYHRSEDPRVNTQIDLKFF